VAEAFTAEALAAAYGGRLAATHVDQLALAGSRVDANSRRASASGRATTPPSSPSAPALLGFASGATGTFLFLRKRALVSDAMAHATLPGVGVAFIVMVALGGDGRNLAAYCSARR
jgi:hypothetical protein